MTGSIVVLTAANVFDDRPEASNLLTRCLVGECDIEFNAVKLPFGVLVYSADADVSYFLSFHANKTP